MAKSSDKKMMAKESVEHLGLTIRLVCTFGD